MESQAFPKGDKYTINSSPIFMISRGDQSEIVIFDSQLIVKTADAHIDVASRKRAVNLEVLDWIAKGDSKLLGTSITLRMSHDAPPPTERSFVEAQVVQSVSPAERALQDERLVEAYQAGAITVEELKSRRTKLRNQAADFPATAQFVVPYQIETAVGTVKGLTGITRGTIRSFPPKGDIFMMDKGDTELNLGGLRLQPVACACAGSALEVVVRPE